MSRRLTTTQRKIPWRRKRAAARSHQRMHVLLERDGTHASMRTAATCGTPILHTWLRTTLHQSCIQSYMRRPSMRGWNVDYKMVIL